jgi:sec-independent protein translocase protein TatC
VTLPSDDPDGPLGLAGSLFDHLAALRTMLIHIFLAVGVGISMAVPLAPHVMEILKIPFVRSGVGDPDKMLKVMEVTGAFSAAMSTVLWTGILISFPLIIWAISNFIFPALKVHEKRYVLAAILLGVFFFIVGVSLGFFWIVPVGLQWLYGINQWFGVKCDFILLKDYVGFVGQMLISLGVAFQVPVIVLILGCIGVLKSKQLKDARRVVIVLLMIAAMLLTPGGDPVSMLCVTLPLALIYEICIFVIWLNERARSRRDLLTTSH